MQTQWLEIIYISLDFENEIRNYVTDVKIASSGIYLFKMIAEMKNAYITALAKEMNISKAAVSQTARRLEREVREKMSQAADILPTEDLRKTEEFLGTVKNNLLELMNRI